MKKVSGWTMYEMALTISLMSILIGVLGTSLYRPIADVFALNQQVSKLRPLTLSMAQLKIELEKPVLNIEDNGGQMVFKTKEGGFKLACTQGQLLISQHLEAAFGVLLDGFDCTLTLENDFQGWRLQIHLEDKQGDFLTDAYRVFYIPQAQS